MNFAKRKSLIGTCAAGVVAVAATLAIAQPGTAAAANKPEYRELAATFEPSAVQQLPDGRLLVVEDEAARALNLLTISSDLVLQENEAADAELMQSLAGKLDDLEALAADNQGHLYAATSYSTTKKEGRVLDRERLVRFKIEGNRVVGIKDAVNLKEALLKADSVQQAITAKTGATVDFNELNIEGLAYDSQQSRLLIGLREPMAGKLSIIIAINNPQALFNQQAAPQFGEVTLLDLGGGIRSLDYVAETNSYLIANEKENEQGKNRSRLWRWDGKPQSAAQPLNFGDDEAENLEALNVIQVGGKPYLLAMADDGKVKKQKPSHYFVMDFNRLK